MPARGTRGAWVRCSIVRQGPSLHNALMPESYAIKSENCLFGTAKWQWRRHVDSRCSNNANFAMQAPLASGMSS